MQSEQPRPSGNGNSRRDDVKSVPPATSYLDSPDGKATCLVLDSAPVNVLYVDLDGTILHVNEASLDTLREIEPSLSVSPDEVSGRTLDVFQIEPPLQWRRVSSAKNLPYEGVVTAGSEKLKLRITALFDRAERPVGRLVTWDVVTKSIDLEKQNAHYAAELTAVGRAQAVIEFSMDGTIRTANNHFLKALGYALDELKGKHHSMLVEESYRNSGDYREFWAKLARGEYVADEFKRIGKGGREVWIQASYNPIFDADGKPFKVVKYATDVTESKLIAADHAGQIAAIGKSQAVIEFAMDGTVLTANERFLSALGYSLDEIKGKHHSLFVEAGYRNSPAYGEFWAKLGRGEYVADEFKRIGKGGREVWIQASYNPILDLNGRPFKVVKFATDITASKLQAADHAGQIEAIGKSQAVIEFAMDGTVLTANEHFLSALGYSLDEIKGKHHSLFVEASYRNSPEYREFWAKLGRGEYVADQFKRVGKGGREVWIQASYNPILDLNGKPFKVVKFATDVTEQVRTRSLMQEVLKGVAASAQSLSAAAEELSGVSQQMSSAAEETAAQANVVSAASEQVSHNVQTVASGTEEMSASIREIAKNATEAARVAGRAVNVAASTNVTVAKLGDSSTEISKVVKVITSIAQQTNLLALNATIEAARAGESGKGFAVVANEVKELAKETAKATEEISRMIEAIQTDTRSAVSAIGEVGTIINQINDIQHTIASAVEEQTATTNEMARNVSEGAKGTNDIARNIAGVAEASRDTSAGAAKTLNSAHTLSAMSHDLSKLVSEFGKIR